MPLVGCLQRLHPTWSINSAVLTGVIQWSLKAVLCRDAHDKFDHICSSLYWLAGALQCNTIMQRFSFVLLAIAFVAVAAAARLDSPSSSGLPASNEEAHSEYESEHSTGLAAYGGDVVSSTKGWWHPFGC